MALQTSQSDRAQTDKGALPKRRLGRTDMQITPVGFGAWAIGGGDWAVGWGAQDDKRSATRSSAASTGSTPQRSTAWGIPRRSCARR
jgi:hypothetical protein